MKRLFFTGLLAISAFAAQAETAAPEKAATCAACHGQGGAKPILPEYPVLAGQYSNYLEHALHEYKDGKRKNAVMGAQAATLSDSDIKALAAYFSAQASPLYTPRIPEHKAKAQ
jgi:cytochrome c553